MAQEVFKKDSSEIPISKEMYRAALQTELQNLYQVMQTIERVPTIDYGQKSLADVVMAFNAEIAQAVRQNTTEGKTFIMTVEGLPMAGKNYVIKHFVEPALRNSYTLLQLDMKDAGNEIPDWQEIYKELSWDAVQDKLRNLPNSKYTTPGDQPSQPDELTLARDTYANDLAQAITRDDTQHDPNEKYTPPGFKIVAGSLLTGTGFVTDELHTIVNEAKMYGDPIPLWLVDRKYMFTGIEPDTVILSRVALESGPWALIWQYYRYRVLQAPTFQRANEINKIFGLPKFESVNEWNEYLQMGGGSPKTVELARNASTDQITEAREKFGRVTLDVLQQLSRYMGLDTVNDVLATSDIERVTIMLLDHAYVHVNNLSRSNIPEHLAAVLYNNPIIELNEQQKIELWAFLIEDIVNMFTLKKQTRNQDGELDYPVE